MHQYYYSQLSPRQVHPHPFVEDRLRDAESDGWTVHIFPHGPLWGEARSPDGQDTFFVFPEGERNMRRHASKLHDAMFRQWRRTPRQDRRLNAERLEELADEESPAVPACLAFQEACDRLLTAVAADPTLLNQLHWREFEELVAHLLAEEGFDVTLTPPSNDEGVDIYAKRADPFGPTLYVVECKRYSLARPIGPNHIRSLYGAVERERATRGILATTSVFTTGARRAVADVAYRLSLRDGEDIAAWTAAIAAR